MRARGTFDCEGRVPLCFLSDLLQHRMNWTVLYDRRGDNVVPEFLVALWVLPLLYKGVGTCLKCMSLDHRHPTPACFLWMRQSIHLALFSKSCVIIKSSGLANSTKKTKSQPSGII